MEKNGRNGCFQIEEASRKTENILMHQRFDIYFYKNIMMIIKTIKLQVLYKNQPFIIHKLDTVTVDFFRRQLLGLDSYFQMPQEK